MENSNINDRDISQFHIIKKNYEWIIKDHLFFENTTLSSPTFCTESLRWQILIMWNHFNARVPFYVILCLCKRNEAVIYLNQSQIKAKVTLSFIINKVEHIIEKNKTHNFSKKNSCSFNGNLNMFNKINEIEFLDENHLTVNCKLIVCAGPVSNINKLNSTFFEQANNDLSKDLGKLLEDKTYSDITLVIGEKEFTAHKAVLVARSPVFYTMFKTDMVEKKTNRVNMKDVKPNVLSAMLSYIYSQKVENIDEISVELFEVAERFELEGLKILCSRALLKKINVQNATETLIWADFHNAAYVKTQALNFIALNKNDIINTEEFKILMKSHPNLGMEIFRIL